MTSMTRNTAVHHDVQLSADGSLLSVRVPMSLRRRGCRKVVVTPAGAAAEPQHFARARPRVDSTLVRALARAFRWQRMLDEGTYATVSELAKAEKLDISFVAHVLRLTLLAPDIVEAVLDGIQPPTLQLQPLMRGFPIEWWEQRRMAAASAASTRRSQLGANSHTAPAGFGS